MKAHSFDRTSLQAQLGVWLLAAVGFAAFASAAEAQGDPDHQKTANQQTCPKKKDKKDGEPVVLFTGNLEIQETDLTIAGRREPFAFTRTYRSGTTMVSALGHHWDFSFNQQIKLVLPSEPSCVRSKGNYGGPYTGGQSTTSEGGGGVAAPSSGSGGTPSSQDRAGPGHPQAEAASQFIGTAMYYDGTSRIDLFDDPGWVTPPALFCKLQPKGVWGKVCYFNGMLFDIPKRFLLRFADGTVYTFTFMDKFVWYDIRYRLTKIETRHGDRIDIVYKPGKVPFSFGTNRIWRIYDTFGRAIDFKYDAKGWLKSITDFDGRQVKYEHDNFGNLLSVTSPAVTGTSTGNDFPTGKPRAYAYGDPEDPLARHHVVAVADANEVEECKNTPGCTAPTPYLTNEYLGGTSRVHKQVYGGTNGSGLPAGGTYVFLHGLIFEDWGPYTNIYRVVRIDPNGNVEATVFDTEGYDIRTIQFTGRFDPEDDDFPDQVGIDDLIDWSNPSILPSLIPNPAYGYEAPLHQGPNADPTSFITFKEFNGDSRLTTLGLPGDNYVLYEYDETSPDVFQRGNLLFEERWNALGTEVIRTGFAYEPLYNQVRAIFEPRGLDPDSPPPNGTSPTHGPARYMTEQLFDYQEGDLGSGEVAALVSEWQIDMDQASMIAALDTWMGAIPSGNWSVPIGAIQGGMPDLNGDGRTDQTAGNRIVQVPPSAQVHTQPTDPTSAFMSQGAENHWQFNEFSLMTYSQDPVGNVTTFEYFAENNPGGQNPTPQNPVKPDGTEIRDLDGTTGLGGGGHLQLVNRPEGVSESFTRDKLGRVIMKSDPRGFETETLWNALHQVERVVVKRPDVPGYTQEDYVTDRIYDANDNLIELRIQDVAPIVSVGSPMNSETIVGVIHRFLDYDLLDNLVRQTIQADSQTALVTEYRYDKNNRRVLTLKPESLKAGSTMPLNVESMIYDERGLLWRSSRGGLDPSFVLAAHANIPEWTLGSSVDTSTVKRNYDANGNVSSTLDGEDHVTTYEYDGFDRLKQVTDAVGNRTAYTLDDEGNTTVVEVLGEDGHGGATEVLLSRTTTSFDERSRAYQVDRALQAIDDGFGYTFSQGALSQSASISTTRHQFDANSRLNRIVDDNIHSRVHEYDGLNRRKMTTDDIGNVTEYFYDLASNLVRTEETDVSTSTLGEEYYTTWIFRDELGRRTATVDNLGHAQRWLYDSRNNMVFHSDAQGLATEPLSDLDLFGERQDLSSGPMINDHGNTTSYTYDDASRQFLTEHDLRFGGVGTGAVSTTVAVKTSYDLNSRVVRRYDDNQDKQLNGNTTSTRYEYDALDRRVKVIYADGEQSQVTYDRDALAETVIDPNGSTFTNVHDALHRLCTVSIASTAAGTTQQTFGYDGLYRVTATSDDNGAEADELVTYAYDTLGRRISEVHAGQRILCEHDGVGNETKLTYDANSGRVINRTYDALDRLKTVADGSATIASYEYAGTWRLESRKLRDATQDLVDLQCGYDGARRREDHVQLDPLSPGVELAGFRYGHDRMDNRAWEERTHELDLGRVWIYDSQYRVIEEKRDVADPSVEAASPGMGGPIGSFDKYTLDGVHNFVTVDESGTSFTNDVDVTNAYSDFKNVAQARDPNGNRLQEGTVWDYEYDAFNRLIVAFNNSVEVARYTYDAANRRKTKILPSGTSLRYVYDGWNLIEERDLNGMSEPLVRQYVHGSALDEPLQLRDSLSAVDYYYLTDAQGSTVGLIDGPSSVTQRTKYDAYGVPEHTTALQIENPLLFTGTYFDVETGLYYLRNRFYDPEQGRFISRDPVGIWADAVNAGNGYAYVGNKPVVLTDPLGLLSFISGTATMSGIATPGNLLCPKSGLPFTPIEELYARVWSLLGVQWLADAVRMEAGLNIDPSVYDEYMILDPQEGFEDPVLEWAREVMEGYHERTFGDPPQLVDPGSSRRGPEYSGVGEWIYDNFAAKWADLLDALTYDVGEAARTAEHNFGELAEGAWQSLQRIGEGIADFLDGAEYPHGPHQPISPPPPSWRDKWNGPAKYL